MHVIVHLVEINVLSVYIYICSHSLHCVVHSRSNVNNSHEPDVISLLNVLAHNTPVAILQPCALFYSALRLLFFVHSFSWVFLFLLSLPFSLDNSSIYLVCVAPVQACRCWNPLTHGTIRAFFDAYVLNVKMVHTRARDTGKSNHFVHIYVFFVSSICHHSHSIWCFLFLWVVRIHLLLLLIFFAYMNSPFFFVAMHPPI